MSLLLKVSRRLNIILDEIEKMTCQCNQHNICETCLLKQRIAGKLKELSDE